MKKICILVLLTLFFLHTFYRIHTYWNNYSVRYDPVYWEKRYGESQWVDFRSEKPIGDDGLYAYEGWKYIHGANPVLLNAEVPFLGKYILGLTILLLGNQNLFGLLTGLLALITFYLLNIRLFKNHLLAFIPVVLFSLEPLFYEQLQAPFFDLLQLSFLFLIFLFVLRHQYIITSIFLGCFAATKFPFQIIIPIATIIIWLIFYEKKKSAVTSYILSLAIILPVYMATYLWYFKLGNSIIDFLKVQKYILNFYMSSAKAPMVGTIFPLVFLGTWYTHFGTILDVKEWRFSWTVLCIIAVAAICFMKEKDTSIKLIIVWILLYSAFLSLTPVFPRYLLLLLPFLYNLAIWVLNESIKGFKGVKVSKVN